MLRKPIYLLFLLLSCDSYSKEDIFMGETGHPFAFWTENLKKTEYFGEPYSLERVLKRVCELNILETGVPRLSRYDKYAKKLKVKPLEEQVLLDLICQCEETLYIDYGFTLYTEDFFLSGRDLYKLAAIFRARRRIFEDEIKTPREAKRELGKKFDKKEITLKEYKKKYLKLVEKEKKYFDWKKKCHDKPLKILDSLLESVQN